GTGNRLSRTLGAVPAEPGSTGSGAGASVEITDPVLAEEYLYDEASNRLLEVTFREEGAITATLALDYTSDGNVTAERVAESLRSLGYDARGRLAEVFEDGRSVARYTYDAFGRRATKTGLQTVEAQRRYLYDERGRLIAEVQDDGSIARELIYLGDLQVAVVIPPGSTGTGGAGAASEQEVDNLSPDFAASSAWAASQAQPGFAGFNYRFTATNGSIVLDNLLAFVPGETRVEIVGSWPTSSRNAGFLFENYAAKLAGDGSAFVRWSLGEEPAGQYRVRVNYTSNPELRASDAPYTVTHLDAAGQPASTTVRVDQRTGGGTLVDLGVYSLDSTSSVTLTDAADGPVVADAVVFEPVEPIADPATWTFTVAEGGRQDLYASWSTSTHNTPAARYSVTRTTAAGIDTTVSVEVDQSESSDGFATLKSLDAAAGDQIVVELSNLGPALFVVADAVRLVTGESTAGDSEAEGLFFVHGDHLDTPQVLTDSEGAEAWRGIHQPFGRTTVLVDRLTHDERFAGQLEDAETGLFYNGFRSTYDPDLGRYLEGDPIGLAGGINPYVYVENNPLSLVDPDGLAPRVRISSGKDNEITRKLLEKLKKEAPKGCNVSILGVNFSPKYAMAIQAGVGEGIASGAECDLTPIFNKGDACDVVRAQAFEETFNIAGQRYNCCTAKRKKVKGGGFGFECAEDPLAGLPDSAVCNAV
ncbi:MAG: RHS repeat-associated core domain-containing protein, partial [Acidobacteriota bacterium]